MKIHLVSIKVATAWSAPISIKKVIEKYDLDELEGFVARGHVEFMDIGGDLVGMQEAMKEVKQLIYKKNNPEASLSLLQDLGGEDDKSMDALKSEVELLKEQLMEMMKASQEKAPSNGQDISAKLEEQIKKLQAVEAKLNDQGK